MSPLYLLDTNIVSAVMADHPKVKARLSLQPGRIVTCAIVRGEIHYGLERLPPGKRRANLEAKAGVVFAALPIEPITQAAADIYGTIRRSLELKGQNIDDNDLWIAAAALSLGAKLVSNDQGFSQIGKIAVDLLNRRLVVVRLFDAQPLAFLPIDRQRFERADFTTTNDGLQHGLVLGEMEAAIVLFYPRGQCLPRLCPMT